MSMTSRDRALIRGEAELALSTRDALKTAHDRRAE